MISFLRRGKNPTELVVIVCNLTPVIRYDYRIGIPVPGQYRERLNSDAGAYGGSGVGNLGAVESDQIATHGRAHSLRLNLPALATLILQPDKTIT